MSWPPALSAYDRAVPHPTGRPDLAARFAELRGARRALAAPVDLRKVRHVVVVCSSSRGGSTHFEALLRGVPGVLTLPGEMNPLVVVAQLGDPPAGGDVLAEEVALQVGRPLPSVRDERSREALVLDVAWRLLAQHPDVRLPLGAVRSAVSDALPSGRVDEMRFTRAVLSTLAAWDLPGGAAGYDLPGADPPTAPPRSDVVIEMTPYVPLRPWHRATDDDLADATLVLATPRTAYRLDYVRALFPDAKVRLLHLTRNPAAAVNGLLDGWLHPGFATVPVPGGLRIPGYSDRVPGGERWWKFDVPPEWPALTDRPLAQVCAAQWCDAHERVLCASAGTDVLRVRHEDLVGPEELSTPTAERLADWLGLERAGVVAAVRRGVAPVMATAAPRPGRWRSRADELAPVLGDARVLDVAERLGLGTDPTGWT